MPVHPHGSLARKVVFPALRTANDAYTDAVRAMRTAKDERRKLFKAAKGTIGIHGLMDEFGMSKKEVEAVIDGRD